MLAQPVNLPGEFTVAGLPVASGFKGKVAWVTDRPGGAGPMISTGLIWQFLASGNRSELFTGSTNASGLFSGVFSAPFASVPTLSLERTPAADPAVALRQTVLTLAGFTIIAERRATLSVLGLDVLGAALTAAGSQPVSVLAIGA